MKIIHMAGKRKRAIARATLREGNGKVKVNNQKLDVYGPEMCRMKIMEPLLLSGDIAKKINISVRVRGGGQMSQAEAARLAIGRCLVKLNAGLKKTFLDYDRTIVIADVRRNEPHKPNDSKPRAKRQFSKR